MKAAAASQDEIRTGEPEADIRGCQSARKPAKRYVMSTVAEQLHLAREAKSLTIHQVAEVTKIRTDHIRALEEGNFNIFSAPVYIKGFVRTYATLLKLDVPRVMATLDEELGQTKKFREPPPLSDQPSKALDFITLQLSKLNWRKASVILGAVAGLIILIVAGIAWLHRGSDDPLANLAPGTYQPAKTGETLPLPPATNRH
jgi:hypothetical protein